MIEYKTYTIKELLGLDSWDGTHDTLKEAIREVSIRDMEENMGIVIEELVEL